MNEAVTAINKMQPRPKFLLIGGDITNAFPGRQYHPEQVRDVRQAFSSLDSTIPMFVASGNHDLDDKPTMKTMEIYRQSFGDEYYTFWFGGVFYIVISSQCIVSPDGTGSLYQVQEAWLEEQLEMALSSSCKHVVLFMHIPPFADHPDEPDFYFSIPKDHRFKLLEQFADAGIKKVFSGHLHRNAGGVWTRKNPDESVSKVEVVASSSLGQQLGQDKAGVRVVRVLEKEITHSYYPLAEIPSQ
ncbi:serine/threonine-protein phosphatase CPPED1-like isoform X2 [Clavelina lepadiformis]